MMAPLYLGRGHFRSATLKDPKVATSSRTLRLADRSQLVWPAGASSALVKMDIRANTPLLFEGAEQTKGRAHATAPSCQGNPSDGRPSNRQGRIDTRLPDKPAACLQRSRRDFQGLPHMTIPDCAPANKPIKSLDSRRKIPRSSATVP